MQPDSPKHRKLVWLILIAAGIFIFAAIPRILQLDAFLTVDENLWYQRSANFLHGLTSGDFTQTVQTGHPGVTTMWSGSLGLGLYYLQQGLAGETWPEFVDRMTSTPVTLDILQWLRLPLALLSALSVVLVFGLGQRLFSWPTALIGAGLLAFDPFFLAHSRVLHHDAATAIFSLVALLSWLLYLKEGRSWSLVIAGVTIALAILSKISSVFLLFFVGLTLLPQLWQTQSSFKQRLVLVVVPWLKLAGITLLTMVVVWPALWFSPLTTINTILGFISHESGAHANGSFFMGQFVLDPGFLFYPVSLAFDLSPLTFIGTIFAIVGVLVSWLRRPRFEDSSNHWLWVMWLLVYVVLFIIFMSFVGKKQSRYILPAVVALDVIAGWGWFWLLARLQSSFQILAYKAVLPIFILLLVGMQLILTIQYTPYYSTYFNPLFGGASVAVKTILVGRGEGLEQAVAYALENSQDQSPNISTWYGTTVTSLVQEQATVKDIMHPNYILGSDYVFFYINQLQREKPDEATLRYVQEKLPLAHTVQLDGIDYVKIYRGNAISHPIDLFADANRLEGKAYLAGFDVKDTVAAGIGVPVRLFWVNDGMQPGDYFYVRLTDELAQDWGWGSCHADPAFGDASTWQDDQIIESECQLDIYQGTPAGEYLLKVGILSQDGTVIGQIDLSPEEGTVVVDYPSGFPANQSILVQNRVETAINDEILLIGYDYEDHTYQPGDEIPLTFYWRSIEPGDQDYVVQLALLDDTEQVAQWQRVPVNGRHPTSVWLPDEFVRDLWQITLPLSVPNGTFDFVVSLVDQAGHQTGSFDLPPMTIQGRDRIFSLAQPPAQSQPAQLGENIRFLGYDFDGAVAEATLIPGQELDVVLIWQALSPMPQNYTVFVQLLNSANQVVAQHDSQPGGGGLVTTSWAAGEYIRDSHQLILPEDLAFGDYHLIAGMYLLETNERLPVLEDGQPVGDHITFEQTLQVAR